MGFAAKIYERVDGKLRGRQINDQPDGFLRGAVLHAQRSPERFPLLSRVAFEGSTRFEPEQREALKSEWLFLDALAVGRAEKNKWETIYQALLREDGFQAIEFVAL
jgi:hypothetical protein